MVILIRCAEHHPLHKGAGVLPHQCVYRYFSEKTENCTTIIIPHSAFHNDMIFDSLAGISDYISEIPGISVG